MTNRMTDTPPEQTLFYTCAGAGSISNDLAGKIAVDRLSSRGELRSPGSSAEPKHKQP
ncbi:hypothetical protein HRPV13_gp08 [Halorubrum pleomorphic virus 13]|nr:hypothetical protein HRPV13_gp08 [Halorubrum pleomorphic virus 13]